MAARLAFAQFTPALKHTRAWPSVGRRPLLARGYASSEHQVSHVQNFIGIQFEPKQHVDDRS